MGSRSKFRTISESSQMSTCTSCGEEFDEDIPCLVGRRISKPSVSESIMPSELRELQTKYSDIALSYHKMKIGFICVFILNGVLMALVVACMAIGLPSLLSNDTAEGIEDPVRSTLKPETLNQNTPRALELKNFTREQVIQCDTLLSKLGAVYMNGQKAGKLPPGMESSVSDLVDSIVQHNKMAHMTRTKKAIFHFVTHDAALTPCKSDSRMLKCLKNWQIKMNTTNIDVSDEGIIVPKEGVYFIYNRVTLTIGSVDESSLGDIDHALRYSNMSGGKFVDLENNKIACNTNKDKFIYVSYIEKVVHLQQKSELKISLRTPYTYNILSMESSSSFGMFEL